MPSPHLRRQCITTITLFGLKFRATLYFDRHQGSGCTCLKGLISRRLKLRQHAMQQTTHGALTVQAVAEPFLRKVETCVSYKTKSHSTPVLANFFERTCKESSPEHELLEVKYTYTFSCNATIDASVIVINAGCAWRDSKDTKKPTAWLSLH